MSDDWADIRQALEASADLLAGLRDGAWLDRQEFPPLGYALPGVIPEGSVLLVGAPKIGKSWLVLTVALAAASGGRALGLRAERRPVLYLALEDGDRRLQDRCRKLLRGQPIPSAFQYLTRIEPGRATDTIAAWLERPHPAPPLVVLDTLGKAMPPAWPGESAYQRDYRVGSEVKDLADAHPGATVLTNHHDRKATSADFVDSVSGTHGLAGAADTVIVLARDRFEEEGLLKVAGRDVPEDEYAVRFTEGGLWALDGADLAEAAANAGKARATAGLGDRMAEIVRYVSSRVESGARLAEVAEVFNLPQEQAGTYLSRAVRAGRLRKLERGRYGPLPPVESVESVESKGATPQLDTLHTPLEDGPDE